MQDRCVTRERGMKINTGGTSGQPLEFLLDGQMLGREWAHMHFIWASRGYRTTHRKLTLRGKHFDASQVLRFNAVSNEYVANSNVPMSKVVDAVIQATRSRPVRWIHGYPSLTAEFAIELSTRRPSDQRDVRDRLFGVLLGSEYPAPQYRTPIAELLSSNISSWYGHSEAVLLARETAIGTYSTFPTYGFAEAVPTGDGTFRLVCTSVENRAHPFVRYDTGDLVRPLGIRRGALEFQVAEGRVGEFITDRQGNKHALTAVIFGRHHEAFELVRHLQVHQSAPGEATLVATPRRPGLTPSDVMSRMNLSGLDFSWTLRVVDEPVRTRYGKIKLKLGPGDLGPG
jgi:phenylacetate-CoA ligase